MQCYKGLHGSMMLRETRLWKLSLSSDEGRGGARRGGDGSPLQPALVCLLLVDKTTDLRCKQEGMLPSAWSCRGAPHASSIPPAVRTPFYSIATAPRKQHSHGHREPTAAVQGKTRRPGGQAEVLAVPRHSRQAHTVRSPAIWPRLPPTRRRRRRCRCRHDRLAGGGSTCPARAPPRSYAYSKPFRFCSAAAGRMLGRAGR